MFYVTGLQWSPDCSRHEREDVPLTSGRGYFVNLWSSMEMTGLVWNLDGKTEDISVFWVILSEGLGPLI